MRTFVLAINNENEAPRQAFFLYAFVPVASVPLFSRELPMRTFVLAINNENEAPRQAFFLYAFVPVASVPLFSREELGNQGFAPQ